MTNCITIREPYASALLSGLKPQEYRNFRITSGKCFIHVAKTMSMNEYERAFFYQDIGAQLTAEATLINAGERVHTKNLHVVNDTLELKKSSLLSKLSADYRLMKRLYIDNAGSQNGKPYLKGKIIGSVAFTGSTRDHENKEYKFGNNCENGEFLPLEKCVPIKGQLSQFKVDL
jgi:hypothetical protein